MSAVTVIAGLVAGLIHLMIAADDVERSDDCTETGACAEGGHQDQGEHTQSSGR